MCRNVRRFHRHLKKHAMNLHPMLQGDWWMSLGISSTAPTNGLTLQVNTFPLFWSGGCKHSFIKTEISVTLALHINDDRQISMEDIDTERPTRRAWPDTFAMLSFSVCSVLFGRLDHGSHCDKMNLTAAFATTLVQFEFCRQRIKTMFVKKILERNYVPVRR